MFYPRNTVFVIGAGASRHYGYPTGEQLVHGVKTSALSISKYLTDLVRAPRQGIHDVPQLVQDAINSIKPVPYDRQALRAQAMRGIIDQLNDIATKIQIVDPLVIDYFLGRDERLAEIGKLLIAYVILQCEERAAGFLDPLSNPVTKPRLEPNNNWIRFILHNLTSGCRDPGDLIQNRVSFITFNYDVSLEQHLHAGLASTAYFSDHGLVDNFFQKIPIIHVYGKVRQGFARPKLSTLSIGEFPEREQVLKMNSFLDQAYDASKGIRTIAPAEKQVSDEIEAANNLLKRADRVFILGYGFDGLNNRILNLGQHLNHEIVGNQAQDMDKEVFFTNYDDHNVINKRASKLFTGNKTRFCKGESLVSFANITYEKSTLDVYKALSRDFDYTEDEW